MVKSFGFGAFGLVLGIPCFAVKESSKRQWKSRRMYKQESLVLLTGKRKKKHRISTAFIFQEKEKYSLWKDVRHEGICPQFSILTAEVYFIRKEKVQGTYLNRAS